MTETGRFTDRDYARFYEWSQRDYEEDLPFYKEVAQWTGGPVLDVACGSGRVSIPLGRGGFAVVGFDASEVMLEIARQRLARESEAVQRRVEFVPGRMETFDREDQFGAVIVPNSSVFELPGRHSLLQCFRRLYRHTLPGGLTVVDVVAPGEMKSQEIGEEVVVQEGVNPSTGLLTRELKLIKGIRWGMQTVQVSHTFIEGEGKGSERYVFEAEYRWLEKDEGVGLLERAGFIEVKPLGDFDRSPYEEGSPRLIFLARRSERELR